MYRAEDLDAGRPVLLQLFAAEKEGSGALERFRRAALAAASLGHPNIAAVQEIGEAGDGRLYLALPPADGETLESLLARGPVPPRSAVDLAAQIAAGLARGHAAGIVHGDLRPSCVLVTGYGEVKVAAFGLGELAAPGARDEGTAAYRAPEVLRGGTAAPPADVWSLGVLLHEMVAGRHPFPAEDERERAAAILDGEPAPLPVPRGGLPKGLDRIVARALARRPEERYPDAGPLETDLLRSFAAGAGTPDLTATRSEMPATGGRRSGGSVSGPAGPTPRGLAGRKLQSYRIFEELGSGAMSVVYRAEDTRLERMVALKFLAPELSRDPQAKARFLREARAASSLDHPNVCTIHEIEETEDGQIFIAMPYYGGETLAQRIARGPMEIDAALDVALQVAQGLAKAHRNGIVHRDVKPANLMLTPDGVVKIVDFGLAKLADSSAPRTGSGGGTIAYVAPEQARGDPVDPRTDLWSLGVVLYEMVAGEKPFQGDTEQAVLYALLREEPRPIAELRPEAPPELARILRRLLAKDPEERTASAESAAADLRALRGPESLGSRTVVGPPTRRPRWRRAALAAAAVAGLGALAVGGWELARRGEGGADLPVTAAYVALADQPGRETFPSLAPDGESLVYALEKGGSSDIYWQRVGGSNPVDLTADYAGIDTQPAFSPDGSQIAFRSDREGGGLFVMGATGESVRRISDIGYNPAWSPDGKEVVCATESVSWPAGRGTVSQLWRIDVAGTERRRIPTGDAVQPSWSPHNLRIAYWGIPAGTSRRVIWTVPIVPGAGGQAVPVVDDAFLNWSPVWSPDGGSLYFASNRGGSMNLWRVPIDERSGRPRGAPQPLAVPAPSGALPSLSRDGRRVAFATQERTTNLFTVDFDPLRREVVGALRAVTEGSRVVRSGEISPDGAWIVFDTSEPQEDIFLVGRDGTSLQPLTADAAKDRDPHWSPDGRRILFYSDRNGTYEAYAITLADRSLERLAPGETILDPFWSPDGRSLVYSRRSLGIALLDLTRPPAERRPRSLPVIGQPTASFAITSWSPDGKWLAGYGPRSRIVLYSFAARRYEVLEEQGEEVFWLRDGLTLLFLRDGAVWSYDRPTGTSRRILAPPAGFAFARLSVGPGDRSLALVPESTEGYIGMITLK